MRIAIDAPPVRALSANEKRVYQLLKEGKTPWEIAKKLHLAMGSTDDLKYNAHDVMPDTIINLITNIRSKGWDIPTNTNEEETPMVRLNEETKREIVQLAMTGTMTHKDIAAKYGIGKSTVWYLVDQFKKRGEIAFQESVNEDSEKSKSDDDNVCEVTADTDIEAYMADRNKKEPATAATETGSEQEICNDIPADIIPETEENVKPVSEEKDEPLIPQSVIEACWGRIDDLRQQIAAEQAVIDDWERQIAEIKEFLELARIANPVGGAV